MEGCKGDTTCGSRPSTVNDLRDPAYAEMATFTFHWVKGGKAKKGQLQIQKSGSKAVQAPRVPSGKLCFAIGCNGRSLYLAKLNQTLIFFHQSSFNVLTQCHQGQDLGAVRPLTGVK